MPTDVISSIGTTGTYTTVQAWEDASPANLVTADERWIGELQNQTFAAAVTISGTTVDATRYTILRCGTGNSFRDNIGSGALAYNTANGAAIALGSTPVSIAQDFTQLFGLQLSRTGTYDLTVDVNALSTLVDSCILQGFDRVGISRDPSCIWRNCLIIDSGGTGGVACASSQGQFYNCTIVRSTSASNTGVSSSYSGLTLENCAVFGFTTAESGTLHAGSKNNATDKASVGGSTGDVVNLTYASQFTSTTTNWRALSTGGLKAGAHDANTTVDILGTTRDATTPYIGCFEVAAAAGGVFPVFYNYGVEPAMQMWDWAGIF